DDVGEHPVAAQDNEPTAQFRLKNHHQAEQHGGEQIIEHAAELGQIETGNDDLGKQEEANDHQAQAAHHARAARPSQKAQDEVNAHGEDGDFHEVARANHLIELCQS